MTALQNEPGVREFFNTLRREEESEESERLGQFFDELEPVDPQQQRLDENLEEVARFRPSRGGELDKMRRSLGSFVAEQMAQDVARQAEAGIARERRLSLGQSEPGSPSLRAVGRATVGLAASAVESPGVLSILAGEMLNILAPAPTRIEPGAGPEGRDLLVVDSELGDERTERIRQTFADIGQPFFTAADKVRGLQETDILKKVYNVDPETPLIEKLRDPRWWREDFIEGASSFIGFLFPGMAAARGARLFGASAQATRKIGFGTSAALITASETGMQFEDMRDDLIANDVPPLESGAIAARGSVLYGAASGLIERGILPFQFIRGGQGIGGWFMRRVYGGVGEMTEEEAQMLLSGLTREVAGLDANLSVEGAIETAIMAAGGGIAVGGGPLRQPAAPEVPRGTQPARTPEPPAEPSGPEAPTATEPSLRRPAPLAKPAVAPAERAARPELTLDEADTLRETQRSIEAVSEERLIEIRAKHGARQDPLGLAILEAIDARLAELRPEAAPPVAEPEGRARTDVELIPARPPFKGAATTRRVPRVPAPAAELVPEKVEKSPHEEIVAKPSAPPARAEFSLGQTSAQVSDLDAVPRVIPGTKGPSFVAAAKRNIEAGKPGTVEVTLMDEGPLITDGRSTLEAAKELGVSELPVRIVDDRAPPAASSEIVAEPTAQPSEAQPPELLSPTEYIQQAGGTNVKALDLATGKLVEVDVAAENVTETLRGERKTKSTLQKLIDCLKGK